MRSMRVVLEPAPGARIVADHLPGDAPALVFLHGLVSVRRGEKSTALFDLAARTGRAAWRFDFRGHGESSGVLHDTTLTELIADARSVLEASGPAFLVGSSLGGLVAAWTAARHPEFVRGLVLLAPALRFLPRLIARSRADGTIVLDHGVGELRFSERVRADLERHDETEMAAAIRPPVFVAHGALDDTVPVDASRDFLARVPHARKLLWVVPDGDHRLNRPITAILRRAARFHGF